MARRFCFLLLLLPTIALSQELTRVDITTLNNFDAKKATVFGLHLGMSKEQAVEMIGMNRLLSYKEEPLHSDTTYRIYVYYRFPAPSGPADKCILYLIWYHGQQKSLGCIHVYEPMAFFLVGGTKDLLKNSVLDSASTVRKNFLGNPDSSVVTTDIPEIRLKHTTHYYRQKGLCVIEKSEGRALTGGATVQSQPLDKPRIAVQFALSDGTGKW